MRKRCLFGIEDDLHAYAERMTEGLGGSFATLPWAGPFKTDATYGPVRTGLLHREGRYQVEIVEVAPNTTLPVHRHPGVDTIECPVRGLMRFTVHGVDPYEKIPDTRLERFQQGKLIRIDAGAWHAGRSGPEGAAFLSMQRWPAESAMTLLGECWEGAPMSEDHGRFVGAGRFRTVPATLEHADYVGHHLRQAEIDELAALAGTEPVASTRHCVRRSERAWAWLVDGEPGALFGVSSRNLLGDKGEPWLLTTELVDRHPVRFLRSCAIGIRQMQGSYRLLENWVDARHTVCVRWLTWLGFTVHPAIPHGLLGLPFHRFEFRAGDHRA